MSRKVVNSGTIYNIFNSLKNRYSNYENIVVACVFYKSRILSYGISKPDNHLHSICNNKQFSVHAEIDAINNYYAKYKNNIRKKIGKIDILTIRINKNETKIAKSCQFCIKSLKKIPNIGKIYYSDNNDIYMETFNYMYNNLNSLAISSGDRRHFNY